MADEEKERRKAEFLAKRKAELLAKKKEEEAQASTPATVSAPATQASDAEARRAEFLAKKKAELLEKKKSTEIASLVPQEQPEQKAELTPEQRKAEFLAKRKAELLAKKRAAECEEATPKPMASSTPTSPSTSAPIEPEAKPKPNVGLTPPTPGDAERRAAMLEKKRSELAARRASKTPSPLPEEIQPSPIPPIPPQEILSKSGSHGTIAPDESESVKRAAEKQAKETEQEREKEVKEKAAKEKEAKEAEDRQREEAAAKEEEQRKLAEKEEERRREDEAKNKEAEDAARARLEAMKHLERLLQSPNNFEIVFVGFTGSRPGFTPADLERYKIYLEHLRIRVGTDMTAPSATHLIVPPLQALDEEEAVTVHECFLRGKWVVSPLWIKESLKRTVPQPEAKFGCRFAKGEVVNGKKIHLSNVFRKDEQAANAAERMIRAAGGVLVERPLGANLVLLLRQSESVASYGLAEDVSYWPQFKQLLEIPADMF
eukprot:TRINITY_DN8719_c0_g1_i4.p1 TRINITY_DN8719_c0_g1~~TRINITY_DN8719_c0_g1_i4.p1  ORF type:complete len:488 (+),score=105.93 TRINITY_DN8719_c0_g1_i4:990-2453(+)